MGYDCHSCGLPESICICIDVDDEDEDGESFNGWDCVFGEACCMPGPHTADECHTAEMAEEWMSPKEF